MQQKIEFRKERDFSSTIGDSLKFLKQNFKSFFASIILIVGPFLLLTSLAYGYMQSSIMNTDNVQGLNRFNTEYFLNIGIVFFLSMVSNILLSGVVYNFMGLYYEKPFGEKITVSEVGKRLWSNIGRLIVSVLTFTIVAILLFAILAVCMIGIGAMMGVAGTVIMVLLFIVGMLILGPILAYIVPASFFVVVRDDLFIFPALEKVRRYLSGSFWWTWLIIVVSLICLSIVQTVFNLPATIMTVAKTFTRAQELMNGNEIKSDTPYLLIFFYTLGMFMSTCTYAINHLICAFNFLSHEEKHEGKGLISRIDEIK